MQDRKKRPRRRELRRSAGLLEGNMNHGTKKTSILIVAWIIALGALLPAAPAFANPMAAHRWGHPSHMFGPHNAAVHFLAMAGPLHLTDKQITRLKALRDTWIKKNSVREARLKAAQADLRRLLAADTIDLKAADHLLARIGSIESGLWHDFVRQLQDIKAMLTPEQKRRLAAMHHRKPGAGMGSLRR